jgi:uridylate kinase
MIKLLNTIINAQTLKEIIQEEKQAYNIETNAECKKQRENRIKEATELNKKYLSILN